MALKPGRVGVDPSQVDLFGNIIGGGSGGDSYTKAEADAKFETKSEATAALGLKQNINLQLPVELLAGSALTVETALHGINDEKFTYADNGVLGAKNRFAYPYPHTSKTENGITFTDNGDGSITISGTASADATFQIANRTVSKWLEEYIGTSLIVSGGLSENVAIKMYVNSISDPFYNAGGDTVFTVPSQISNNSWNIYVRVKNGTNLSTPVTVKPMLRLASDTDNTYQPYAMTNRELTDSLDGWTTASLVQSDNTVTFTGLNDNYGYDLYCENKLIGVSSITKTGSGNNITLVYTVTGATAGDSCKLRVIK